MPFILLTICVILAFAPSLPNGFNIDDIAFLNGETSLLFPSWQDFFTKTPNQHYAPLNFLLNIFLFDHLPANPVPFRLINIFFFLCNCGLLYILLKLLTQNRKLALVAAVIFCLHPLNITIVDRISFNIVLLCLACMEISLIGLWLTIQNPHAKKHYILTLVFALLAMLCQETAFLLPLYAAAMLFFLSSLSLKKITRLCMPLFLLSLVFLLIWFKLGSPAGDMLKKSAVLNLSLPGYFASVSHLIFWYVSRVFWPQGIVFIKNIFPITAALAIAKNLLLLFFVLSAAVIALRQWGRSIRSLGLFWFLTGFLIVFPACLAHAPMGLVIEPYWFYFSSIGIYLLIGIFLLQIQQKLPAPCFGAILAIALVGLLLWDYRYHRNSRTEKTYCEYWLRHSPDNHIALQALANIASEEGHFAEAKKYCQQILKTSFSPQPLIFIRLAVYSLQNHEISQARDYIQEALFYNATEPWAWNTLGAIEFESKNFPAASKAFSRALGLNPQSPSAMLNLIHTKIAEGSYQEALALGERLSSFPLPAGMQKELSLALAADCLLANQWSSAEKYLSALRQRYPGTDVLTELLRYLTQIGSREKAQPFFDALSRNSAPDLSILRYPGSAE